MRGGFFARGARVGVTAIAPCHYQGGWKGPCATPCDPRRPPGSAGKCRGRHSAPHNRLPQPDEDGVSRPRLPHENLSLVESARYRLLALEVPHLIVTVRLGHDDDPRLGLVLAEVHHDLLHLAEGERLGAGLRPRLGPLSILA